MENPVYLELGRLYEFFNEFESLSQPQSLEEYLTDLFDGLKTIRDTSPLILPIARREVGGGLDPTILESFLDELSGPVAAVKSSGFFCDPWEVASLRRDEVRNAKALAWFLDCRGSHGMGNSILVGILRSLKSKLFEGVNFDDFGNYSVNVENCPDGNRDNRVDIEIFGDKIYLIIEVKIDAPEGHDQINRYCRIADSTHSGKNWAVIYLTPQGKASAYQLEFQEKVILMSWRYVASSISDTIRSRLDGQGSFNSNEMHFPDFMAKTFAKHIKKF